MRNNGPEATRLEQEVRTSQHRSIYLPLLRCLVPQALEHGLSPPHSVLLGVVTAVGGGILRDLLIGQIPSVLYDRQLYALPAMLGAGVMASAYTADLRGSTVTAGAAVLAFGLRVMAMRYGWRAPRPRGIPD